MKKAVLERFDIEKDRLYFETNVMGRLFSTSIWYKNVDFRELQKLMGRPALERVVAHIAAFEMNKYGSLHLDQIDLGELNKYVDNELVKLWNEIFVHVWAQWRFENNLPHDKPPKLIAGSTTSTGPSVLIGKNHKSLTFFGGGKDSFVSSSLLQGAGIPFDVLEYSSSKYGNRAEQSDVEELAHESSPHSHINELAVYDDFLDSPILEYDGREYKIHTLAAAETPASVFESLPIVLQSGYQALALGHEKSANYPNLIWKQEDDNPINHQWGKSLEAQKRIAEYIKEHLISDVQYYSTLMPLSDPAIFTIFSTLPWESIVDAHSCNVTKPWCRRCAKCVYVWLFYLAFLDEGEVTAKIFNNETLFDIEDNHNILRMLVGLYSQTPFECVGQPPESKLAIALCYQKGFRQPIVKEIMENMDLVELENTINTQFTIDEAFLNQCELPLKLHKYYLDSVSPLLEDTRSQLLKSLRQLQ
jgi:hypothetical protein